MVYIPFYRKSRYLLVHADLPGMKVRDYELVALQMDLIAGSFGL